MSKYQFKNKEEEIDFQEILDGRYFADNKNIEFSRKDFKDFFQIKIDITLRNDTKLSALGPKNLSPEGINELFSSKIIEDYLKNSKDPISELTNSEFLEKNLKNSNSLTGVIIDLDKAAFKIFERNPDKEKLKNLMDFAEDYNICLKQSKNYKSLSEITASKILFIVENSPYKYFTNEQGRKDFYNSLTDNYFSKSKDNFQQALNNVHSSIKEGLAYEAFVEKVQKKPEADKIIPRKQEIEKKIKQLFENNSKLVGSSGDLLKIAEEVKNLSNVFPSYSIQGKETKSFSNELFAKELAYFFKRKDPVLKENTREVLDRLKPYITSDLYMKLWENILRDQDLRKNKELLSDIEKWSSQNLKNNDYYLNLPQNYEDFTKYLERETLGEQLSSDNKKFLNSMFPPKNSRNLSILEEDDRKGHSFYSFFLENPEESEKIKNSKIFSLSYDPKNNLTKLSAGGKEYNFLGLITKEEFQNTLTKNSVEKIKDIIQKGNLSKALIENIQEIELNGKRIGSEIIFSEEIVSRAVADYFKKGKNSKNFNIFMSALKNDPYLVGQYFNKLNGIDREDIISKMLKNENGFFGTNSQLGEALDVILTIYPVTKKENYQFLRFQNKEAKEARDAIQNFESDIASFDAKNLDTGSAEYKKKISDFLNDANFRPIEKYFDKEKIYSSVQEKGFEDAMYELSDEIYKKLEKDLLFFKKGGINEGSLNYSENVGKQAESEKELEKGKIAESREKIKNLIDIDLTRHFSDRDQFELNSVMENIKQKSIKQIKEDEKDKKNKALNTANIIVNVFLNLNKTPNKEEQARSIKSMKVDRAIDLYEGGLREITNEAKRAKALTEFKEIKPLVKKELSKIIEKQKLAEKGGFYR